MSLMSFKAEKTGLNESNRPHGLQAKVPVMNQAGERRRIPCSTAKCTDACY